jgi:hypothetical protein
VIIDVFSRCVAAIDAPVTIAEDPHREDPHRG